MLLGVLVEATNELGTRDLSVVAPLRLRPDLEHVLPAEPFLTIDGVPESGRRRVLEHVEEGERRRGASAACIAVDVDPAVGGAVLPEGDKLIDLRVGEWDVVGGGDAY